MRDGDKTHSVRIPINHAKIIKWKVLFGMTTMDDYILYSLWNAKNRKENYVFMLTFWTCLSSELKLKKTPNLALKSGPSTGPKRQHKYIVFFTIFGDSQRIPSIKWNTLKNNWQILLSFWQFLKSTRKFSFWLDIQSIWKVTCRFEKYIVDFFDNSLMLELSNRHPKLSFDFERNKREILKWQYFCQFENFSCHFLHASHLELN
jgi:hypothetical protein